MRRWTSETIRPVLASYQRRFKVLRHHTKLDDEITGQVRRFGLAALFPPEPPECLLVIAHDDPGIRAADEGPAAF
jgi:hypothetical protein